MSAANLAEVISCKDYRPFATGIIRRIYGSSRLGGTLIVYVQFRYAGHIRSYSLSEMEFKFRNLKSVTDVKHLTSPNRGLVSCADFVYSNCHII